MSKPKAPQLDPVADGGRDCYGKLACAVIASAFADLAEPEPVPAPVKRPPKRTLTKRKARALSAARAARLIERRKEWRRRRVRATVFLTSQAGATRDLRAHWFAQAGISEPSPAAMRVLIAKTESLALEAR